MEKFGRRGGEIDSQNDFLDLKYSIHIFDDHGNRLADIDKNGVKLLSDKLNVFVSKEIGKTDGWARVKVIYVSDGLQELVPEGNRA